MDLDEAMLLNMLAGLNIVIRERACSHIDVCGSLMPFITWGREESPDKLVLLLRLSIRV